MSRFKNMSLVKPCTNCPVLTDVPRYLHPARYLELAAHLLDAGENFVCHKTLGEDDDNGDTCITGKSCTCAGAMIFMQKIGRPNQMMQVMERISGFNPDKLHMDAPVYATRAHFETGQAESTAALCSQE